MKSFKICISLISIIWLTQLNASTINDFSNCTAEGCHLSQTKFEYLHNPVKENCLNCHQTDETTHPVEGEKEFNLTAAPPQLCKNCHDPQNQMSHVHKPVNEGKCLSCHNPHSSDYEFMLVAEGGEVCNKCHTGFMPETNMIHGPVAANMCNACHNPHQSELNNLLLRDGMDLCLFCHTNKKDVQTMPSVHNPFLEGCLQCHQPHSSPYKFMVKVDVPGLCFNCHEAVEVEAGRKSEVHGPFQEGEKCYLCHNAHVSEYAHLLQDKEQNLCFTCHEKDLKKGNRKIKNIKKRVVGSNFIHAPIEDDGCAACHAAHTPDNFFLLSAAFPKGSYGEGKAESFAHCFDCHDAALMEKELTQEDTGFRNGNQNLHYLHVNREKARNCTTCHDIHGSKYAHLIAEKVPFGKWAMPLKYKITPDGGSCLTGCHKELAYNRNIVNK
jgi:predicted CXXCH cytochrome family protein